MGAMHKLSSDQLYDLVNSLHRKQLKKVLGAIVMHIEDSDLSQQEVIDFLIENIEQLDACIKSADLIKELF